MSLMNQLTRAMENRVQTSKARNEVFYHQTIQESLKESLKKAKR